MMIIRKRMEERHENAFNEEIEATSQSVIITITKTTFLTYSTIKKLLKLMTKKELNVNICEYL